ncbi:MAG: hypothetical protein HOM96_03885 [Rickettsiales bacterium]|jgi:hypothetical protein|nr:hypothetical protein [Rickettsiales bacterium]
MNFFKQFKSLGGLQEDLNKISGSNAKDEIKASSSFFGKRIDLWRSKRNEHKKFDIELVSFTDTKGNTDITSLVVEGKLVSLSEAREMLEKPAYQDSNLSVIVNSLNLGTNFKAKTSSGLKIGSKLYRDDLGNVFLSKPGNNQEPLATIKSDSVYLQETTSLLKDMGGKISLAGMNLDKTAFKEQKSLIKGLMERMESLDNLSDAHKTEELTRLQESISVKAKGLGSILDEITSLDNQVEANINIAIEQLDFLDSESPKKSQEKIADIVETLSRAASGPSYAQLDKMFKESGLVDELQQEEIKGYFKSKVSANDASRIKEALVKHLTILDQSFSLADKAANPDLEANISLNSIDLSNDAFVARLTGLNSLMEQISGIKNIEASYKGPEIEEVMGSITSKATEVKDILNEMISLEQKAGDNISIDIDKFDFLENDNLESLHEKVTEIKGLLKEGLNGPNMQAIEDLLSKSVTLTQSNKEAMAGYIKHKVDEKDRSPVMQHIVDSLTVFEASVSLIKEQESTVKDIGEFLVSYVNFRDNANKLESSGKLSEKDKAIFDKVNSKLSKNMDILIGRYTEHLKDLDYEHKTTHGTSLKAEQEFLRGVTPIVPELEYARDISSDLIHFAEHAGFKGKKQMSELQNDVKEKILKHYAAGTFSRPRSESFDEASRRDKSQQMFYSKNMLQSLDAKLPHDKAGNKDINSANLMLSPILSGDYQMVAMATSSLKNPNDLSGALLDDYVLHFAETGTEISHASDDVTLDIAMRKTLLEHQIRVAKRDLASFITTDSLGSIKLSESLNAARAIGVDATAQDIDLLFVYAALSEIRLDTLSELESGNIKSKGEEEKIFARLVDKFINEMGQTKLSFLDNPEFRKLGLNPRMVDQADIITAIARTGFSNFKTLNQSLQRMSISAKILASDPAVKELLVKQFMANDVDLLARELQSNTMTKLFNMGHIQKAQLSSILDIQGEKLSGRRDNYYAKADDHVPIERRSKEVSGLKVGRRLTNLFSSSGKIKMPNGKEVSYSTVGDAMDALRENHLELSARLSDSGSDFAKDKEQQKPYIDFEDATLDAISGNVKSVSQLTHMALLYGYDQLKVADSTIDFAGYLDKLNDNPSQIKNHLIDKFKMTENATTLLDLQARKLTYLTPKERMQEMLEWHDDVHISSKAKELKVEVDKQNAAIGSDHLFSGLSAVLAPMKAGDEFMIDQTGKLTVKNDQEFLNLAQEALTEGAVEVVGKISVTASNGLKIVKEEKGYSVIFNNALGVEFGLGISTAMGLAESSASVGSGVDKGYKITFGNSHEQEQELNQFIRKVFFEPDLKVDDLARAESIYLTNGGEMHASAEISFGLPSVINSIAVGTGFMQNNQEATEARDEHLGALSAMYRVGQAASVGKKVSRETRRGEIVVTHSYRNSYDFSGVDGMEGVLIGMGVGASNLHSQYSATTKTTEKYGMITDHTIRTEMTVESNSDKLQQSDKSLLALSGLLKNSYEHDIFMNDEDFKRGFSEKLESYEDKSPVIIVERKVRQDVLEDLTAKSQEFMHEYKKDDAIKRIKDLTEKALNNPDNIEISRVLIRSEQKELRSATFRTTEVKAQTSEEINVNRRALEEERAARKESHFAEQSHVKATHFINPDLEGGERGR